MKLRLLLHERQCSPYSYGSKAAERIALLDNTEPEELTKRSQYNYLQVY